jgi:hypothetical protein
MKPNLKLLRPARAAQPDANPSPSITRERDALFERKRALERDREALATAAKALPLRLSDLIAAIRKDSQDRPPALAGSVVIRVLGAMRDDQKPVPLPKLRVTLAGAGELTMSATTDVTGLAVLPLPPATPADPADPAREDRRDQAAYRLTIAANDGSEVAHVEADPSRTHLLVLGDVKGLEGHAALGRGWLAAIDRATAQHEAITRRAGANLAKVQEQTIKQIEAVSRRLELHFKR